MNVSRRRFLATSSAAAFTVGLPIASFAHERAISDCMVEYTLPGHSAVLSEDNLRNTILELQRLCNEPISLNFNLDNEVRFIP